MSFPLRVKTSQGSGGPDELTLPLSPRSASRSMYAPLLLPIACLRSLMFCVVSLRLTYGCTRARSRARRSSSTARRPQSASVRPNARTCAYTDGSLHPSSVYRLVNYCMHRVRMLKYHGIKPYIVFDGGALPAKLVTEDDRAQSVYRRPRRRLHDDV
jgi:hypothetical protein